MKTQLNVSGDLKLISSVTTKKGVFGGYNILNPDSNASEEKVLFSSTAGWNEYLKRDGINYDTVYYLPVWKNTLTQQPGEMNNTITLQIKSAIEENAFKNNKANIEIIEDFIISDGLYDNVDAAGKADMDVASKGMTTYGDGSETVRTAQEAADQLKQAKTDLKMLLSEKTAAQAAVDAAAEEGGEAEKAVAKAKLNKLEKKLDVANEEVAVAEAEVALADAIEKKNEEAQATARTELAEAREKLAAAKGAVTMIEEEEALAAAAVDTSAGPDNSAGDSGSGDSESGKGPVVPVETYAEEPGAAPVVAEKEPGGGETSGGMALGGGYRSLNKTKKNNQLQKANKSKKIN